MKWEIVPDPPQQTSLFLLGDVIWLRSRQCTGVICCVIIGLDNTFDRKYWVSVGNEVIRGIIPEDIVNLHDHYEELHAMGGR